MKKFNLILVVLIMSSMILGGCNGNKKSEFKYNYDANETVRPLWETDVIYNETVLLLEETKGGVASGKLRFKPKEILSVRDSSLKYEFKEGTDYTFTDGKICRVENSSIPYFTEENTHGRDIKIRDFDTTTGKVEFSIFDEPIANHTFQTMDAVDTVVWLENTILLEHLINVTYSYNKEDYTGPKQEYVGDKLPQLTKKLDNKEDIRMLVIGDSIACGGSSSGNKQIEPFMGSFYDLLGDAMQRKTGKEVIVDNKDAVGGQISDWSLAKDGKYTRAQNSVRRFKPDVVLVHYGMNDGTWGCTPERYKSNLVQIMDDCRAVSEVEDLEFIFVGTCMPNNNGACYYDKDTGARTPVYKNQPLYAKELKKIPEEEKGCVFVDGGEIHQYFLKENKKFLDMSASGINHPNDFVIRLYSMNLVKAIIK